MLGRALPLSVKGARALRHLGVESGPGLRAQARLRHVRARREDAALFVRLRRQRPRRRPVRHVPRRLRAAAARSIPLDRGLYIDVHTYMVDDILTKVDRMSMAVSLEAREPLLDHRLLEFAATVPLSLKIKDGRGKYLLRKALERKSPARDPRARQAGLRGADRRVAARAARADGRGTAVRRPSPRPRRVQRPRGHAALDGAPRRPRRPSAPALAADDARAVVPPVHRQGARARARRATRRPSKCAASPASSPRIGSTPTSAPGCRSCGT